MHLWYALCVSYFRSSVGISCIIEQDRNDNFTSDQFLWFLSKKQLRRIPVINDFITAKLIDFQHTTESTCNEQKDTNSKIALSRENGLGKAEQVKLYNKGVFICSKTLE